jgi:hypothetical protein
LIHRPGPARRDVLLRRHTSAFRRRRP